MQTDVLSLSITLELKSNSSSSLNHGVCFGILSYVCYHTIWQLDLVFQVFQKVYHIKSVSATIDGTTKYSSFIKQYIYGR